VDMDTIFRGNPWKSAGTDGGALKMSFMACFNTDMFLAFVFESSFLQRFSVPEERLELVKKSDVEAMKLGFDWVKFFLTGSGPLVGKT